METYGSVDLYWIPLGAGATIVRITGRAYERLSAVRHHREPRALYHSALIVSLPEGRFTIEQTPVPDPNGWERGVVAEGPVGTRMAGRFRLFRYEVRCWQNGSIPDLASAVSGPVRVTEAPEQARRIVETLPSIPTPTWGRDELRTGEMWNSNSVTAWALVRSGIGTEGLCPPAGGRAIGWHAGICVAGRQAAAVDGGTAGPVARGRSTGCRTRGRGQGSEGNAARPSTAAP